MIKGTVVRWQTNFFTGLAVILPVVITLALVVWLFGTVSNITDTLLFFLPRHLTHLGENGQGDVRWQWSLVALLVAFLMVSMVGRLTRYYIGRKLIHTLEFVLLNIPLLNKIYGTIKQVNDAFSSNKKSAFQQVVLVEFPRTGMHSIGFVTNEGHHVIQRQTGAEVLSVFVPTTPNPTTGFLVLVPQTEVIRLDISVADGIKFLISLGSVPPEHPDAASPATLSGILPTTPTASGATEFVTAAVQRAVSTAPNAPSDPSKPRPPDPAKADSGDDAARGT